MKTILLIMSFAVTIIGNAQKKCNYDVDKYDKFLKIHKIEKEVTVDKSGPGYIKLIFCKYDSLVFFRLAYSTRKGLVVGKDDPIMFLCDDESSIKAFPNQIYSSEYRNEYLEVLNATYYFKNSEDIDKLKSKKVKSIRIYYNSVYWDTDIKGKFSDALNNTAQCF